MTFKDVLSEMTVEERIYRFRCVEAWSMVIPWNGFELADLLNMAGVQEGAKYVAFETATARMKCRAFSSRCWIGHTAKVCDWMRRCTR